MMIGEVSNKLKQKPLKNEYQEKEVIKMPTTMATVLHAAIASGNMSSAIQQHGGTLTVAQKESLAKVTPADLTAIKSIAEKGKTIGMLGDKLA